MKIKLNVNKRNLNNNNGGKFFGYVEQAKQHAKLKIKQLKVFCRIIFTMNNNEIRMWTKNVLGFRQ